MITVTRRIEIMPIGDNQQEIYSLIKSETRKQNMALNEAYGHLYFNYIARDKVKKLDTVFNDKMREKQEKIGSLYGQLQVEKDDKKKDKLRTDIDKKLKDIEKTKKAKTKESFEILASAIGINEQTQLRDVISHHGLMSDTKDRITQIVAAHFKNDITEVLQGKRSLRTYRDNPLFIRGRNLTVSKENKHYQIHWRNKTTCLKVILGRKPSQVGQVKQTLDSVINGSYKVCDSSIQSKGKKLFLLLTVQHEKQEMYLDANKVIGVDVGINVSAFCVLNTNVEIRKQIGNERKLIESKSKLQAMRRKAQSSARYSKGGHGRTRKTRYIEQLKERERNFAKTYNNQISHDVVQFALKCRAGVIHLEKLTAKGLDDETRMQWTYYQLQEMIEQKANKYNIEVVYVPATYTSQKCSLCGHIDKENRKSQAEFKCTKCENEMNADWNAAINIAQAVLQ